MSAQIPKYYETFIPILKVLSENNVLHYKDLEKQVRDRFYKELPAELLEQKTKSGAVLILNRIGWGKAYLKQAEMIQQPERGLVQITEKGRNTLMSGDLSLKQILTDKEFLKNRHTKNEEKEGATETLAEGESPDDMIDAGINSLESQVENELLERLRTVDPYKFEEIVGRLIAKMGYGDFHPTAKSGDGGIDGIINQDKLGLDKIFIQAKRYAESNRVREPLIRDFIGAMSRGTKKGIFVTTSSFDESARKKVKDADHIIILIDGRELVNLMYKYDIGVQTKVIHVVKQVDGDFFEED